MAQKSSRFSSNPSSKSLTEKFKENISKWRRIAKSTKSHKRTTELARDDVSGGKVETVLVNCADRPKETKTISFTEMKIIGSGSFGIVYHARLLDSDNTRVAIKKVNWSKKRSDREVSILRRLKHNNIVKLKYFFHSRSSDNNEEIFLNIVMEYIPMTMYLVARPYRKSNQFMPILLVKLLMYQLFRGLAYIHSMGIGHRDLKPRNLLVDPETDVLKICDFGSAKYLQSGVRHVPYICSRYYRAPELVLGSKCYTTSIDLWSAGCIFGELLRGELMFFADTAFNLLVEIIKVLGSPSKKELRQMNPKFPKLEIPQIEAKPWREVFGWEVPEEGIDLIDLLLQYPPNGRPTAMKACAHPFFNVLRDPRTRRPNGKSLPPLFNFSARELRIEPDLNPILIPNYRERRDLPVESDEISESEHSDQGRHTS